jgi:NTE family protein
MPSIDHQAPLSPARLAELALFAGLDESALAALSEKLELLWISSGTDLFVQDEQADALYVLLSGTLAVLHKSPEAEGPYERLIGRVHAGETVGEMAILSGRARSATVRAIRDCEVARFKRSDFEYLMAQEPSAMLQITRIAFSRLEASIKGFARKRPPAKAFAILPSSSPVEVAQLMAFASQFQTSLESFGEVAVITEAQSSGRSSADFHGIEQKCRYVLYISLESSGAWFELCKRQSDEWLNLHWPERENSSAQPSGCTTAANQSGAEPAQHSNPSALKRQHLIFIQSPAASYSCAAALADLPNAKTHQVRSSADIARVARLLTGHATGLVLGGGGARGFAHLGVIRALREHGLQIDATAGTSIGAVIAAGLAMQWDDEELYLRYHRSFVAKNPLRDYTFPFIALVAGRGATARLKSEYGNCQIEDLALPYFCISTNLTRGTLQEHNSGPLWLALRASIAIPGILPPVFHRGEVFVDGGVINNLPVDVMRKNLSGRIIGVDIAGDYAIKTSVEEADLPPVWRMAIDWFKGIRPRPNILQILLRSGMVNSASAAEQNRRSSDCLIQPPVEQLELLDWQSFDRAIEIGYSHTRNLIEKGLWDNQDADVLPPQ